MATKDTTPRNQRDVPSGHRVLKYHLISLSCITPASLEIKIGADQKCTSNTDARLVTEQVFLS